MKAKQMVSKAKKVIQQSSRSAAPKKMSTIAGIEKGTLLSVGATVLGAAAVIGAGYLLWRKRDQIVDFAEKVGDGVSDRLDRFTHNKDQLNSSEDQYSKDLSSQQM